MEVLANLKDVIENENLNLDFDEDEQVLFFIFKNFKLNNKKKINSINKFM